MEITLAENLKKMRTERGLTQGELAKALSVTPQSVSRWETGQVYPDIGLLPAIASFFDVSLDELMMGRPAMSFEKLLGMLTKAEHAARSEPSRVTQRQLCDILEMVTSHPKGNSYYLGQYFAQLMKLKHKWGGGSEERINKVRAKFRNCLREASPDERSLLLTDIVCYEEEDKLVLWREYLPGHDEYHDCPDVASPSWNDLLFRRYRCLGDDVRWEERRQHILYRLIGRAIGLLCHEHPDVPYDQKKNHGKLQDVANYEAAMALLNTVSSRADDVFLCLRCSLEFDYAGALFAAGETEKGFAMLSLVEEHTKLHWKLDREGAVVHGSVPFLSSVEEKVDRNYWATAGGHGWGYFCLLGFEKRQEFDSVRDDERFKMYVSRMEYIIPHTHYIGKDARTLENIPDFAETFGLMHELAYNTLRDADGDLKTQATVFLTSKGNFYHVIEPDAMSGQPKTLELLDKMKENKDCRIDRCLTVWWRFGGEVDVPSYEVRQKMVSVDLQNADTKILLLSDRHFVAPPLSRLLH